MIGRTTPPEHGFTNSYQFKAVIVLNNKIYIKLNNKRFTTNFNSSEF
ncbi:MAG: hypothetical protein LBD03_08095 [Methanobrevibacter sp.]|nr:hypothetical protein [Candidatus Methanovirga procula]